MRERRENIDGVKNNSLNSIATPYFLANLGVKTAVISFSVSALTQPFQAILTRLQLPSGAPSALSGGMFRGFYRGFVPYAIAGQKRGAVAVTAKHTNKAVEEEEIEIPSRQRWLAPFLFSQGDLLVSNGLGNKSKLMLADIVTPTNFKWTFPNFLQLTKVNWGARSIAGFINFSALGFMGDRIGSLYNFNNGLYNNLAAGATAGVIATFFTTIPNCYADKKLLASKMENGRLLAVSPFTMFSQMKSHVKNVGLSEAFSTFAKYNFLKEVLIRSPQSALTFSIIFGLDHLMGAEPLKKVWPCESADQTRTPKL